MEALGNLLAGLSEHESARRVYKQAIASYEAALRLAPDDIKALYNVALAEIQLAILHKEVGEISTAYTLLQQAHRRLQQTLRLAPNDTKKLLEIMEQLLAEWYGDESGER